MGHLLTTLFIASLAAALQSPDSTVMNLTVGPSDGVPTTTIIPVAEPPIKEVDTTTVRITPPDSMRHHRKKRTLDCQNRDSRHCPRTKRSQSYPER